MSSDENRVIPDPQLIRYIQKTFKNNFVEHSIFEKEFGGPPNDPNALHNYLRCPPALRAIPSLYFDRDWYLAKHGFPSSVDFDPFLHFLSVGFLAGFSPHPLVDLDFMIRQDSNVLGTPFNLNALFEALELGLVDPSPYFALSYYDKLARHSAENEMGSLRHFLTIGLISGLKPQDLLDVFWYAGHYPDVPRDPYEALRHFVLIGDIEGRESSNAFNGTRYLKRYADVEQAGIPPLKHYLLDGRKEGRQALIESYSHNSKAEKSISPIYSQGPNITTPDKAKTDFDAVVIPIRQFKQRAIEAFSPVTLDLITTSDLSDQELLVHLGNVDFPTSKSPSVTILIPVYNEGRLTIECLLSLGKHPCRTRIEIIIADDASSDPLILGLSNVSGINVVRQEKNIGFLKNCNRAYLQAKGKYVFLLNNDTQMINNVIDQLTCILEKNEHIYAVGPKILYPNGRLQEAGCSIDIDGSSEMHGLFQDPESLCWNYDRDVHYISGAALMVRKSKIFGELFDEQFAPAYCEDTDLCLRLHEQGGIVRYCSGAIVAHHLSVSTGKESRSRRLQQVSRNQQKLAKKWAKLLLAMNRIRTIAFYLPQFHPTRENDAWWGQGFTEWTNVTRARPSFSGHYQPHLPSDLGFYDLRVKNVFGKQDHLAAKYGLTGFCVYYYNFDGKRVLDQAFEAMFADSAENFSFCVCWANENWTKHWDGGTKEILLAQTYDDESYKDVINDVIRYAQDPRYICVNEAPIFVIYRPALLPDAKAFASLCRDKFKDAGFDRVHLVYVESMELVKRDLQPSDIGFDACVEFPPQGRAVPSKVDTTLFKEDWTGYRYDYVKTVLEFANRPAAGYKRYPAVFPSWDNTPRQPLKGTSFDDVSPASFQAAIESKIAEIQSSLTGDDRLLFVNAWNEWAEGAHLEPDQVYGHQWLEALRNALHRKRHVR